MTTSDHDQLVSQVIRRSILTIVSWLVPTAPLAGVFVGLSLGLNTEDTFWAVTRILPPVFITGGILLPLITTNMLIRRGLRIIPGEPPERRYARILKVPWKVGILSVLVPYLYGGVFFTTPVTFLFNKSILLMGFGLLVATSFGVVLSVPVSIRIEQLLMPYALEERGRMGERVQGKGFFWPRLSWYLPYVFSTTLAATLLLTGMVVALQIGELRTSQMQNITEDQSISQEQAALLATKLQSFGDELLASLGLPLLLLGIFILLFPPLAAWLVARRQARAAAAVQEAIEALASGSPTVPNWCSTDEIGDLSMGMLAVLERLKEIPTRLQASATRLGTAGNSLSEASSEQRQSLMQQAAAIQEAQVTSQEIRQTSELAARKAETVLGVASRAEQLGQSGEAAIDKTLTGLNSVRQFVDDIRTRVVRVQESASQIGDITTSVKDLADQSNILAINASIEAARSGEQGRGFAVVAKEFRSLADQSIKETARIGRILAQVDSAIRELVAMTGQGAQQVEGGLEMARSSGDSLRELSGIIQESAAAARQIAAAVSQQNTGVTQIFTAISQLSTGMDATVQRLDTTLEATRTLETVTREVSEIAQRYQITH